MRWAMEPETPVLNARPPHRYPHNTITRWAMEYLGGANQALTDIMAGGLSRFHALQQLTICNCKV